VSSTQLQPQRRAPGTHDLGSILREGFAAYRAAFGPMFAVALLTVPMQLLTAVISGSTESEGAELAAQMLQFPAIFVSLVVSAALARASADVLGGRTASFGGALDAAFARIGPLITTFLLELGLLLASTAAAPLLGVYWLFNRGATIDGRRDWWLALIPGALTVYLLVRWIFASWAVMLDARQNWAALDESARVVRSRWWRTLGIVLGVALVQLVPAVLTASAAALLPPLALLPFAGASHTVLYADLRARSASDAHHDAVAPSESDSPR
jgi:hypothetical protein